MGIHIGVLVHGGIRQAQRVQVAHQPPGQVKLPRSRRVAFPVRCRLGGIAHIFQQAFIGTPLPKPPVVFRLIQPGTSAQAAEFSLGKTVLIPKVYHAAGPLKSARRAPITPKGWKSCYFCDTIIVFMRVILRFCGVLRPFSAQTAHKATVLQRFLRLLPHQGKGALLWQTSVPSTAKRL